MKQLIQLIRRIIVAIKKEWFLPLLRVTNKIFFAVTILVLIFQIIDNSKYPMLINSEDISNFLNYYSISIKFFTALLALIVVRVTLERLAQTDTRLLQAERQMRIISENNKYNNFIVHKKQFINDFHKKDYIKKYEEKNSTSADAILTLIYGDIYYNTFNEFEPKINSDFKNKLFAVANKANELVLKNGDKELYEYSIADIQPITNQIQFDVKIICINYDLIPSGYIRNFGEIHLKMTGSKLDNWCSLYNECRILSTALNIYEDFLLFDGRPSVISSFPSRFNKQVLIIQNSMNF